MNGEHDDDPTGEPADQADRERQMATEAVDRLNDSNRVLIEARMLPKDKPLTADQVADVVERFNSYSGEHRLTSRQVARECGYSSPVISEWSAGKYKGDVDAVTHAVNDWMERDARRRQSRRPKDYVKTWIAESVRTYAYLADKRGMMAAIVVPAGAGKTKVLKALTAEMRGVYVYCNEGVTARDLYRLIGVELGWQNKAGTRGQLLRFIVDQLKGTNRILFVDEAQNAGKHIGCLRSVHDQAQVPIVMAGTDEILQFANDRDHGRGQFSSRCIRYNAMDHVHNAEGGGPPGSDAVGRDLFSIEEIQAFFSMKKIRVDRDALNLLWALACLPSHGTLRLVENTIDTVMDLNADLTVVTRDYVVAALQSLVGSEAVYLQRLTRRHIEISRASAGAVARAAG
jgi:DNA transposition AAA+ family ATPase